MLQGDQGVPIRYEVMTSDQWDSIRPGEILDIDWDYFACLDYEESSISKRVEDFLSRDLTNIPLQTVVCHSPEYCHPTRQQFEAFVEVLATKFEAEVIQIPKPIKPASRSAIKSLLGPIYQPVRNAYRNAWLALHRRGIY